MKKIAVLMTCFNRVKTTLACLERLFAQEIPEGHRLDVWLVDDASPDETGRLVKEAYPQVNVIKSPGNLFWCKGMRLAWDKAAEANNYDFYLWLNDDVLLLDGVITSLILDNEKVDGVLVGTCASDASLETLSYGSWGSFGVMRPNGEPQQVDWNVHMSGNFVLVPREVFKRIGPIYGGYSHAYGDSDYERMLNKNRIRRYCGSRVTGICPKQPARYKHAKDYSFGTRFSLLFDPLGYSLHDVFVFRCRHWGVLRAVVSCLHVITKVLLGL